MLFANPLFLWGLTALAIPVIIHLYNFRRYKRVDFSNVALLEELKMESKRKSQLKQWLILGVRLILIFALVMAFSQPFFPNKAEKIGSKQVSIYVDNSLSMEADQSSGSRLVETKKHIRAIIDGYGYNDKFQLLTNEFSGKQQRFMSKDELLLALHSIDLSPTTRNFSEIIERQRAAFSSEKQKIAWIVSDLQRNNFKLSDYRQDSTIQTFLLPIHLSKQENISIDSCWMDAPIVRPNEPLILKVRLKNFTPQLVEKLPIKLTINGEQKGLSTVNIKPDGIAVAEIAFSCITTGVQLCELSIDDFPVTFDDLYYFNFTIATQINITAISPEPNLYLEQAFAVDSTFDFSSLSPLEIDFKKVYNSDLIILSDLKTISSGLQAALIRYIEKGGSLAIFPSEQSQIERYNSLLNALNGGKLKPLDTLKSEVLSLNYESPLFKNLFTKRPEQLDLPTVAFHFPITVTPEQNSERVMTLADGNPFLTKFSSPKGVLWLFASEASRRGGNFVQHALFVPVLYRIALLGLTQQNENLFIGEQQLIHISNLQLEKNQKLELKQKNSQTSYIPQVRSSAGSTQIMVGEHLRNPGHYNLMLNDSVVKTLSLNINRKESNLDFLSNAEVEQFIRERELSSLQLIANTPEGITQNISVFQNGTPLYRWFVLLALLAIACEALIIRFKK